MSRKRIFGCLLALALVAGAFLIGMPETAQALPSNEVTFTYYSDAEQTTIVGERMLPCTGGWVSWGTKTAYYTVDSIPCSDYNN